MVGRGDAATELTETASPDHPAGVGQGAGPDRTQQEGEAAAPLAGNFTLPNTWALAPQSSSSVSPARHQTMGFQQQAQASRQHYG
jgi:hypothetical protein